MNLEPDAGISYIDQNGYRLPQYPLLPIFRAVETLEDVAGEKKIDWSSVDIVTDRNNILKLLEWADKKGCKGKGKKEFRIDVQLVGNKTALFQRWEERRSVKAGGPGFGDSFERASSRAAAELQNTTLAGHLRVVTYVSGSCSVSLSV